MLSQGGHGDIRLRFEYSHCMGLILMVGSGVGFKGRRAFKGFY